MSKMKHLILGLLVFLTLTPVMACAMSYCPMQSTQSANASCHESTDSAELPMLAVDCMGVDLFQTDNSNNTPQPSDIFIGYITVSSMDILGGTYLSTHSIRAPPQKLANFYAPPLILTTGRFRV